MTAIHLDVMKLERHRQRGLEQVFAIPTPTDKRIGKDARILVDDAVEFCLYDGRRADDGTVVECDIAAFVCHLSRQRLVVMIELLQILRERNIAVADASLTIVHNHIEAKLVVAEQLGFFEQHMKLVDAVGSLADAPAQQRIELHACTLAHLHQTAYIQCLHKRHHRHRR